MLGDGRGTLGAGHLSDGTVGVGEVLRKGEGNRAEKARSGTVPRRALFILDERSPNQICARPDGDRRRTVNAKRRCRAPRRPAETWLIARAAIVGGLWKCADLRVAPKLCPSTGTLPKVGPAPLRPSQRSNRGLVQENAFHMAVGSQSESSHSTFPRRTDHDGLFLGSIVRGPDPLGPVSQFTPLSPANKAHIGARSHVNVATPPR